MKKTYSKKQIEESVPIKGKPLQSLGLNDEQLNAVFDKMLDVLDDFNVGSDDESFENGTIELTYDVIGHIENSGIGAYEYWGSKGYDRGVDYFETEDYDFDYKTLTTRLENELGVELELDNSKRPETFDADGKRARERANFRIYVNDEQKLRAAIGQKPFRQQIEEEIARLKRRLDELQKPALTQYNVVREFGEENGTVDNWLLTDADMKDATPSGSETPLVFGSVQEAVNAMWSVLESVYGEDFAHEAHDSDMDEKNGEYFFDMEEGAYEFMKAIPVGTYDEKTQYAKGY